MELVSCRLLKYVGISYSLDGDVYVNDYVNSRGRIVRGGIPKVYIYNGYKYFKYRGRKIGIHRMLCEEKECREINFKIEGLSVDHINSDSLDNSWDNIRLVSVSEQMHNVNTINKIVKSHRGSSHNKPSARFVCVSVNSGEVIILDSIKEAKSFIGVSSSSDIIACCNGKLGQTHGYRFYFWEDYYGCSDLISDDEVFVGIDFDKYGDIIKGQFCSIDKNIEVSNLGRVRINIGGHWHYTSGCVNKLDGRRHIVYRGKGYKISQLVCLFFHPGEYIPGYHVRHLDNDKSNDRADNLAWGSSEDNLIHDARRDARKCKKILSYDMDGNFIREYFSISEAHRIGGFSESAICGVCSGKHSNHHGIVFRYKKEKAI